MHVLKFKMTRILNCGDLELDPGFKELMGDSDDEDYQPEAAEDYQVNRLPCNAHDFENVIKKALKQVKPVKVLLGDCSGIVNFYKNSNRYHDELMLIRLAKVGIYFNFTFHFVFSENHYVISTKNLKKNLTALDFK